MNVTELVLSGNTKGLESALRDKPSLANEELPLPDNPATAHPLHRLCDGVFNGIYSEEKAIEFARIFLAHGAELNSPRFARKDSPLTAACSLNCDQLALFYIDNGADINHRGCHGGTALHWASWCGRDVIVRKLVTLVPDINILCVDFKSTPLFWALHGYRSGNDNRHHQVECARILLANGADRSIPNFEGYLPIQLAGKEDHELRALLQ